MPNANRRSPGTKSRDFQRAWNEVAPEASFAGMTLAEFDAALAPFKTADEAVNELTVKRTAAVKVRTQEEESLRGLLNKVAHAVRADLNHGDDSPLYRAMGFVPRSERASGLTRRANGEETSPDSAPPESEEAVA